MTRRGRGVIAITAAAASVLAAGCGEEPTASDFDPTVAEEYVRNQARADVRANPALSVQAPQSPEVACRQKTREGGPPPEEERSALFTCDVEVPSRQGDTIARQSWRAKVELEPATGDTVVRSSRRVESTIQPAG
jgi:hypothetical protein